MTFLPALTSPHDGVPFLRSRILRIAAVVLGGSVALTLSAKVQVSFWPVPITMQSMIALLIGVSFGFRLGSLTLLAYLAEGFAGAPVFAGVLAGPAYLFGPTGGYLIGFCVAGAFSGWAVDHGWTRDLPRALILMLLGHLLILVPGTLWLGTLMGWRKAMALGVEPFLLGTVVKSSLGAAIVVTFPRIVGSSPKIVGR